MEVFEVHITGDYRIIDVANKINVKNISVDLLKPDGSVLRTEHMTSYVLKCRSFEECKLLVEKTVEHFVEEKVRVLRVKIESPDYVHYRDRSLYMESHFSAENEKYPLSRNRKKTHRLATDREYDRSNYDSFRDRWNGEDVELCLHDTWLEEDKDWFDLYAKR
jgi:hypothetical protein